VRPTFGFWVSEKTAPTLLSASMNTSQVLALPEQSPVQFWNVQPFWFATVSVRVL
jgi:hypothetical protein